jgi:choline-sulfatase
MAGEHGLWWKNVWHEASSRVPMIISTPQHRRGELTPTKVKTPVSLLDMFPTFCGIAGAPIPEGLDGVDVAPLLRNEVCDAATQRPGVICESFWPRWGECAEFRLIRSERYKYIAFRGCEDMAFDMVEDPDEQHNLVGKATGEVAEELERLRKAVIEGFDFDAVAARRAKDKEELPRLYGAKKKPKTPNQIRLGDGRLVEADAPLYYPQVVSNNMAEDYADFPGQDNFMDD